MNWRAVRVAVVCAAAGLVCASAFGLGEPQRVSFARGGSGFALADGSHLAPLCIDPAEWPGVGRAVASFAGDEQAVTGQRPVTSHAVPATAQDVVLVGTVGHSALLDGLIASGKLDVSAIRGHWEMSVTQVVDDPFPGVKRALIIAGSDKRGTIFGVYGLSEQIGVSPWTWWADVRVPHHEVLVVSGARYVEAEPKVKYRGIFLNDEAPSLTGWTQEKFGGYNHRFYEHVFELLLRLRANYLWPAMWNSAFNEDDPVDPKLADEYGIVMGTSHHEPMLRAQQEWKRHGTGAWDYTTNAAELDSFWAKGIERNRKYESTITIGMRGDGDVAMSPTANTALLEKIVAEQRKIIDAKADPKVKNPQIWALYKEVQGYYEAGMRVPDDVTLLWCDDNWGNIRRLPTAAERTRPGGAGIYYHFDYVGDPRDYKWLLTYNITKVWEQMHLAVEYGADRVWIVNVGDLKPMEFPIEFFLTMARDPERWDKDHLMDYTRAWATREFGPEHSAEIAELLDTYTRYNARRKPEQLEPTTYRVTPDGEADRVYADWEKLTARAEKLYAELPQEQQASFFELVLYPLKASANVGEMYIDAGRNRVYAKQGRPSANLWAEETRRRFAEDAELSDEYNHKLLNGKWDHMMDQTHIGYTYWQQPPANAMPGVQQVQVAAGARLGVFGDDSEFSFGQGGAQPLPAFDSVNRQTRTLDLAPMGDQPVSYTVTVSVPWITVSSTQGTISKDTALKVAVDWGQLSTEEAEGAITVASSGNPPVKVAIRATRVNVQPRGFVENAGVVAIEAEDTSGRTEANGIGWEKIPGFGETRSGMEAFPVLAASSTEPAQQACLDYDFSLLSGGARTLEAVLAPTLPFSPEHGLRFGVAVDGGPQQVVDAWKAYTDVAWSSAVSDGVHKVMVDAGNLAAGNHSLRVCRVDPGVVVERLAVFSGKAPVEYLGPVESVRAR